MDGLGDLFADDWVAVGAQHIGKHHPGAKDFDIIKGFDKLTDFRVFQTGVRKDGRNIGIQAPDQMKQNGAILAAGKADIDIAIVAGVPFNDSCH